jgi:hypothetical protein
MIGRDAVAGVVLAGLGLWVNRQGRALSYRDEFGPGPGFLPYWLGLLLITLALCLIVSAVRGRPATVGAVYDRPGRTSRALLAILGMAVTVAVVERLGFMAGLAMLTFYLVYAIERRSFSRAVTVAVALTLSFFILFRIVLPLPLPVGAWGF